MERKMIKINKYISRESSGCDLFPNSKYNFFFVGEGFLSQAEIFLAPSSNI